MFQLFWKPTWSKNMKIRDTRSLLLLLIIMILPGCGDDDSDDDGTQNINEIVESFIFGKLLNEPKTIRDLLLSTFRTGPYKDDWGGRQKTQ